MTLRRVTLGSATLFTGLSAGFLFAYQISVTRGLAEIDDVAYVATFQAINRAVINVWFGVVFFGAIAAIVATLITHRRSDRTDSGAHCRRGRSVHSGLRRDRGRKRSA
jgi:uncharacterized membrane protein